MLFDWYLILFLGTGGQIEVPGAFATKEACIEHGEAIVAEYKKYHPHSRGFHWCIPGKRDGKGGRIPDA